MFNYSDTQLDQLIFCVQIGNKGLVSFGRRDKGRKLKLKPRKKMICPYLSDIGAGDSFSGKIFKLLSRVDQ